MKGVFLLAGLLGVASAQATTCQTIDDADQRAYCRAMQTGSRGQCGASARPSAAMTCASVAMWPSAAMPPYAIRLRMLGSVSNARQRQRAGNENPATRAGKVTTGTCKPRRRLFVIAAAKLPHFSASWLLAPSFSCLSMSPLPLCRSCAFLQTSVNLPYDIGQKICTLKTENSVQLL